MRPFWFGLAIVFLYEAVAVMRLPSPPASASRLRVALLTDVEGNWQYVRNVARQSSCLQLVMRPRTDGSGDDEALELHDDCMLVFGGDGGDKGDETLRCYEQLLQLKRTHPDRVVLLVGNRDVNKMRLTSELHDAEMDLKSMAREILEGPMWVAKSKRVTLTDFLAAQQQSETQTVTDEALNAANTKVNRLKWMLEHTMGAQGDFERRRVELQSRQATTINEEKEIDDEAVLASYLSSVQEGGVLREYLLQGSLAFVAHQTLFVHGGIIDGTADSSLSALGRVPDEPTKRFDSVSEWVDRLNTWYRREVQAWLQEPTWNVDHTSRGGNELLKYVLPDYPGSVVMGRHLLPSGMPTPLPAEIARLLTESGIRRVIVGHTPHGNCPTVIKQPQVRKSDGGDDVLEAFQDVIMCDTSYSDPRASDNRGGAASEVVVELSGHIHVNGVLEDGRRLAYDLPEDEWVGRTLRDGTMVKARLADEEQERQYLVFRVDNGFSYTYHCRTLPQLLEIGVQG